MAEEGHWQWQWQWQGQWRPWARDACAPPLAVCSALMGVVAGRRRGTAPRLRLWSFASGFFCAAALFLLLAQWRAWGGGAPLARRPHPSPPSPPTPRRGFTANTPYREGRGTGTGTGTGTGAGTGAGAGTGREGEKGALGATGGGGGVTGWIGSALGAASGRASHSESEETQEEASGRRRDQVRSERGAVTGGSHGGQSQGAVTGGSHRGPSACHRRTSSGLCVTDVFRWADESYRELWPGGVDLLIRSYISEKFFLLNLLFHSIDQMWPKNIGDVVLVMDEGNAMVLDLVPSWVKVYHESNHLQIPGKILQQWSYAWADNYTSAPFVAIIDDDVVFALKVTPSLLFNLTTGKPYIIASNQSQEGNWLPSTEFLVGPGAYVANFMVQLPWVVPRGAFAAFRAHVGRLHPEHGGTYDEAMRWFAFNGPEVKRTQIQHTAMGNFMYKYYHDAVDWVPEWSQRVPIPRVGVHLPYAHAFRVGTGHIDGIPRVTALYAELAGHFAHEGVCHSLPPGALAGCAEVLRFQQKQIWMYALDWYDWPRLFRNRTLDATQVYDRHIEQMRCIYRAVEALSPEARAAHEAGNTDPEAVARVRDKCLRTQGVDGLT